MNTENSQGAVCPLVLVLVFPVDFFVVREVEVTIAAIPRNFPQGKFFYCFPLFAPTRPVCCMTMFLLFNYLSGFIRDDDVCILYSAIDLLRRLRFSRAMMSGSSSCEGRNMELAYNALITPWSQKEVLEASWARALSL